ncbi:MAG: sigma-70 family RNA polymerase sigma factor [Planctomycetes bacterium]|nr:sigma-70 family RNA polymerase sigma factor [Planctomycetota bacterium]
MDLAALLDRARDGDAAARGELVDRFYDRVAAMVHRQLQIRLRPQQHALLRQLSTGDVVQEVFVEVLRGLERWDGDSAEAFTALLATLVEHRVVDQIRRSQAARRDVRRQGDAGPVTVGATDGERGPGTLASNREEVEIYREVIASFPERERALLALRLEDHLEFQALAERLGYPSPDAARKAFHSVEARLLLRLRQRGLGGGGR